MTPQKKRLVCKWCKLVGQIHYFKDEEALSQHFSRKHVKQENQS